MNEVVKKKVLIICTFFYPDTVIAAVRMSNFAVNLKKMGYDVTVIHYGLIHRTLDESLIDKIKDINVFRVHDLTSDSNSKSFFKPLAILNKILAKFFPILHIFATYYFERKKSKLKLN